MSIHDPQPKETQKPSDGAGPLYHRVYSLDAESTWENALRSMQRLQQNINHFSPQIMCRFEKVSGQAKELADGDEFQIHITGPWNGPVLAKDVSERAFTLITLEGHIEAGEIRFRIDRLDDTLVRFEIESVARSKDLIVDFMYDKIPIVKLAQTEMWKQFCEAFGLELSFGTQGDPRGRVSDVKILTERRDEDTGHWETL